MTPNDTTTVSGGVYIIDTTTGSATALKAANQTPIVASGELNTGNNATGPNGLASTNNSLYYSTFNGGVSDLWKIDLTSGVNNMLGALAGPVASGALYNGSYYYVTQSDSALYKVDLGGSFHNTLLQSYNTNYLFGDIAIDHDGKMYLSYNGLFGSLNLASPTSDYSVTVLNASAPGVQLAFSNGVLYGVRSGIDPNTPDAIYSINTATGAYTQSGSLSGSFRINDAAEYFAVPEPSSWVLLGLGGLVVAITARRQQRGSIS